MCQPGLEQPARAAVRRIRAVMRMAASLSRWAERREAHNIAAHVCTRPFPRRPARGAARCRAADRLCHPGDAEAWKPIICPCCWRTACLRGHVARANPVWKAGEGEALAIFLGPHAYVSPNWYPSKAETGKAVPTWNYITVHARGHDQLDPGRRLAARPCRRAERTRMKRAATSPGRSATRPPAISTALLRAIVGFELTIAKLEGKWKLSQNRDAADHAGARDGLLRDGHDDAGAADGALMQRLMRDWLWYGALLALGAALYLVCRFIPPTCRSGCPGNFPGRIYLATALTLAWFVRGLKMLPQGPASAAVAADLFCAGRGQLLDRAADPHRLLRPAHVLCASLGAFRAASCRAPS